MGKNSYEKKKVYIDPCMLLVHPNKCQSKREVEKYTTEKYIGNGQTVVKDN